MGLKKVEDRPTPQEVYNWKIYLTGAIIAAGSLLFGYTSSFVGNTIALDSFKTAFKVPSDSTQFDAVVVSVFQAGAFFGAIAGYPLMEIFGRKPTLQIATSVFLVAAVLQTAMSNQLGLLYAGRVLCGLGVGIVTCVCPVYLAELSPPAIRGRLIGFYEIAYQIAAVVGFWIVYGIKAHIGQTSIVSFRIPFAIQIPPAAILLVGSLFLKESPRFLLKKDKPELAIKNLTWLRNLPQEHEYIGQELNSVALQIDREREVTASRSGNTVTKYFKGIYSEFSAKGIRNRLLMGFMIMMFQNMSGINAINYYSPTLFADIGITDTSLYSGIYGVLKAVASIVFFLFFVDQWGRRQPLIWGALASGACMFFIGAYIKIAEPSSHVGALSKSSTQGGQAATAAIMLFSIFYCFGWNGLAWIICAEIYPLRIRGICSAWTACCQWLFQWIIAYNTPAMSAKLGYGMFMLFASFNIVSAVYAFFVIPETKGRSLEDMDEIFGYKSPHDVNNAVAEKQQPDIRVENTKTMADRTAEQNSQESV